MSSPQLQKSNDKFSTMHRKIFLLIVFAATLLVGCDFHSIAARFIPEPESQFALRHFDLYRTGSVDEIISQLSPSLVDDEIRDAIQKIVDHIPSGDPTGFEIVGSQTFSTSTSRTVNLTIQYEYPDRWLIATIAVDASTDVFKVAYFNADLMNRSLQDIYAFRLSQNGLTGLAFIFFSLAVPVFCIAVFVVCLRTPIPKGKWRWAIFTLLGCMSFHINWTTGETAFQPLSIQLFGAGFSRSGFYGPWILSVAVPFGALVFLAKRGKWLRISEPDDSEV